MYKLQWLSTLALILVLPAFLPAQDEPAAQLVEGWGTLVDPDGDCGAELTDEGLTIRVPGSAHDLSVEIKRMNAPRVVQDIEGDFIAQVRVHATHSPAGESVIPGRLAYNGAGLLLFGDKNNYVRLERGAILRDGEIKPYISFERRSGGEASNHGAVGVGDEAVYVRLERRAGKTYGAVSTDGARWTWFPPFDEVKGDKLQLGVAAINSCALPFTAQFEKLALFKEATTGKKAAAVAVEDRQGWN